MGGVNNGSEQSENSEVTSKLLSERIAAAKDGDVIDITKEGLTVDKTSYTISKNITIQNGDLNGAIFIVEEESESRSLVGDFIRFILYGLFNTDVTVKTPANVNMKNSKVNNIRLDANADLELEESSSIAELVVNTEESTISSSDTASNIAIVIASENASSIELGGSAQITTLLSSGDAEVTAATGSSVTIEASDVSVSGAKVDATFAKVSAAIVHDFDDVNKRQDEISAVDGVYSITLPQSDEIWDEWMDVYLGITDSVGGENYKIVFDVKTDVDAILPIKVRTNYSDGNERVLTTIANTWYPVTIYTGVCPEATKRFILEIPADNPNEDVTVSLKNVRYCKASDTDKNAPLYSSESYYMCRNTASVDINSDGSATIEFTETKSEKAVQGVNLRPKLLTNGKWNKVTYKLKTKNATTGLLVATHSSSHNNEFTEESGFDGEGTNYGTSWGFAEPATIPANTEITFTTYLHPLKGHSTGPYDREDENNNPFMKIYISDTIPNVITMSDVQVEVLDSIPSEMNLVWCQNGESEYKMSSLNDEFSIIIPPNSSSSGKAVLSNQTDPYKVWETPLNNNSVTSCTNYNQWDGILPEGIKVDTDSKDSEYMKISNTTDETISLSVNISDTGLHFELSDNADTDAISYYDSKNDVVTLGNPYKSGTYEQWNVPWASVFLKEIKVEAKTWYKVTGKAQVTNVVMNDNTDSWICLQLFDESGNNVSGDLHIPNDKTEVTFNKSFYVQNEGSLYLVAGGNAMSAKIQLTDIDVIVDENPDTESIAVYDEETSTVTLANPDKTEYYWSEVVVAEWKVEKGKWYRATGSATPSNIAKGSRDNDWIHFRVSSAVNDNTEVGRAQIKPINDETTAFDFSFKANADTLYASVGGQVKATIKLENIKIEETDAPKELDAWWYYDIPVADGVSTLNIIFNDGNGTQTVNIEGLSVTQNVYAYAWWDGQDKEGNYYCEPSTEEGTPKVAPEEGKVRIYWHSKLSEGLTPHLHYWSSEVNNETKQSIMNTNWPGVEMTIVSE